MSSPVLVPQEKPLADAIASDQQVKMVVIGSGGRSEQIAGWAGEIADNALQPGGFNARCALWLQTAPDPHDPTFGEPPYPTVAVLDRANALNGVMTDDGDNIDPPTLELMFLNAGA